MTLTTVTGRPAHRDEIRPADYALFEAAQSDYFDGIHVRFYGQIIAAEKNKGLMTLTHNSGHRLQGPVQPIVKRQARATLRSLGVISS